MHIAILGTGNMGLALGTLLCGAGHKVILGSRRPEKARDAAGKLAHAGEPHQRGSARQGHATATLDRVACEAASVDAAIEQGEMVIIAQPYPAALDLVSQPATRKALAGKLVIDITNPLAPDLMGLTVGQTTSAAEEIARRLPESRVVKAFNTIFADLLRAKAQGQPVKPTVFCAGDDPQAKAQVLSLIGDLGFPAVDAGGLRSARFLEPLAALVVTLGYGQKRGTRFELRLV
jgi:NADPH-dependent F420 reductase